MRIGWFLAGLFVGVLTVMSANSSLANDHILTIGDLVKTPTSYLGKQITIKGILGTDVLQVPHFYQSIDDANAHNDLNAIDVISDDRRLYDSLIFYKPTCMILEGSFHISGKDSVTTGSFISKIGFIKVTSIKHCH
jgi:hypothetical protein